MLEYFSLDPWEQISVKVQTKLQLCWSKKVYIDMSPAKYRPFCPGNNEPMYWIRIKKPYDKQAGDLFGIVYCAWFREIVQQ